MRRLHYYVQKGLLYSVRRGLYAKNKKYDRKEAATKIFTPSYISFETVLFEAGVIFQLYKSIFVASYQTREVDCDGQSVSFRKIKNEILVHTAGLENRGTYFAATKERAFLDILYLRKGYHFDNLGPLDFKKVFELLPIYNNKRMITVVNQYYKDFLADRRDS